MIKEIDKRYFKRETVSFRQINNYLDKAAESILVSQKILKISEEASFKIAYDGMLKITLALILSYGLRPRSQVGHHFAMIKFTERILGKKYDNLIKRFNKMRQRRNRLIYDISIISRSEAVVALDLAKEYLKIVRNIIEKSNPQKKLI